MELPASLLNAARDRTLIPFAGAGVSMSVRGRDGRQLFMNWEELLKDGANRLREDLDADRADFVESCLKINRYLDAAEELKSGLRGLFDQWIRNALSPLHSEVEPNSLALARSIWNLGSDLVLTTNYDQVLRWSCPRWADLEEWTSIPPLSNLQQLSRPTIWHLHGSVANPSNLIISESDYKSLYRDDSIRQDKFITLLRDIMRRNILLFIGFSMDDAFLENEIAWLEKCFGTAAGRHYLLVVENRAAVTRERLKHVGALQIISYADHGPPLLSLLSQLNNMSIVAGAHLPMQGLSPTKKKNSELGDYLYLSQETNATIDLPNLSRRVLIEDVWVEPKISGSDGDTRLSRLLANRAIAFVAPGGYGKSTVAKFLTVILARDRLGIGCPRGHSWQKSFLGIEPGEDTQFPLLIQLKNVLPQGGHESLLQGAVPAIPTADINIIRKLIEDGRVAFILDGLDEIPVANRGFIFSLIKLEQDRYPKCYFIITTRLEAHPLPSNYTKASIKPLSVDDISNLMLKWATVLSQQPHEIDHFLSKVRSTFNRDARLYASLNTPLLVSLLCLNYFASGDLPTSRASLYESVSDWLLNSRSVQRNAAGIDVAVADKTLRAVAYLLRKGVNQTGPTSTLSLPEIIEATSALAIMPGDLVERIIITEAEYGSCISSNRGRISFWHVTIRDFYAAKWLVALHDSAGDDQLPDAIDHALRDPSWREVGEMFIGLTALKRPQRVNVLIEKFGKLDESDPAVRIVECALRSRILSVAQAHGYRADAELRDKLQRELTDAARLNDGQLQLIETQNRVYAFATLGILQLDSRLFGKPSSRLISLPLPKDGIKLGRYPVTVQEYARFVRSGAYEDPKWWMDFHQPTILDRPLFPMDWDEQKTRPNSAVVGVSFHEALAYCKWLTLELKMKGKFRLPTASEWIFALTGSSASGGRFSRPRYARHNITAPVGIFPENRGIFGHDDMGGLIWEWLQGERISRRKRTRISASRVSDVIAPIYDNGRGRQRSHSIGFRLLFEEQAEI